MLEWLPAYHDGELSASRRRRVETHLQDCPSCRAELHTLQGLSALLQTDPVPAHISPERFAAQVQLLLPRTGAPQRYPAKLPRWVLGAPLLLIVVWAFLQAALWVTSLALAGDSLLAGSAPFTTWLASDNSLDLLGTLGVLYIGLLVGVVILWASWMAFWWTWKHNQNLEPTFNRLEKEV